MPTGATPVHATIARMHRHGFSFNPQEFAIADGVAGALLVALIVGATLLFRSPELGWAAFAAFWTCLERPVRHDWLANWIGMNKAKASVR
jgi:hypothetical protein